MSKPLVRPSMRDSLCTELCMMDVTEWEGERSTHEFKSADSASENLTI